MLLGNRHTNYKVQNAFNKFGHPSTEILELCDIQKLAEREVYWCNKLNALGPNGLCIVEPGIVGFGTNSNYTKYSKYQILKVFSLLYKGQKSQTEIEQMTKVQSRTVKDISLGNQHLWLREQYPQKYDLMLKADRTAIGIQQKSRTIKGYLLTPQLDVVPIHSYADFVRNIHPELDQKQINTMVQGLARVLRGERKTYKGYSRANGVIA